MTVQRYVDSVPIERGELSSKTVVSDRITMTVDAARKRISDISLYDDGQKREES